MMIIWMILLSILKKKDFKNNRDIKRNRFKLHQLEQNRFKIKKYDLIIEISFVFKFQSNFFFKNIKINTKYLLKKKKLKFRV